MSEHQIQSGFFSWWETQPAVLRPLAFAIPNGGFRPLRTGAMLRREGARAGVPDVFVAIPVAPYAGLWLEFKTPTGRVSPVQKAYLDALGAIGYKTAVVRSVDDAISTVQAYLKGE